MSDIASTCSISEVRIALREDLVFRQQCYGGESCYVIEDPAASQFHRIGLAEYAFVSLMDGTRTIRDAMHCVSATLGREAFTEQEAAAISRWLVEMGLAKTNTSDEADRLYSRARKRASQQRQSWINPIIAKIPVFCPDPWLDRIVPWLLWMTTVPAFAVWCVVCGSAVYQLMIRSDQLSIDAGSIISTDNWLLIGTTWLVLKLIHETAHALFCRKYDGDVREAGVLLIALAPIFYVDVTSSWRFNSKWQRIAVAAAGMYVELFVGAIAALVWLHSSHGLLHQAALNVAILSTVTTILFNANPLMRFDGYYILSDLLEIPNLAPQGQGYLSYLGKRYIYGVEVTCPFERLHEGVAIRTYGVLAFVWQILITVGIAMMAATLLYGAGLILVLVGLAFWIGVPLASHTRYLVCGQDREQPRRLRFAALATAVLAVLAITFVKAPWPFSVKAPAIVEYAPPGKVHAGADGFVEEILVEPGQRVEANQLLAVLRNVELQAEIRRLKLALASSVTRIRIAGASENIIEQQLEFETSRAIKQQLAERIAQLDGLQVRATMAGTLVTSDIDALQGTFVGEGQEILTIGDERSKEFVLSVAQEDAELFETQIGKSVVVQLRGVGEKVSLQLGNVEPNASTTVHDLAITAVGGGCVNVRQVPTAYQTDSDQPWEYVSPRFKATIDIPRGMAEEFRAGQLAMVKLPVARGSLGQEVYRAAEAWLRRKWKAVQRTQRLAHRQAGSVY